MVRRLESGGLTGAGLFRAVGLGYLVCFWVVHAGERLEGTGVVIVNSVGVAGLFVGHLAEARFGSWSGALEAAGKRLTGGLMLTRESELTNSSDPTCHAEVHVFFE